MRQIQITLCHPDDIGQHRKSSGWHPPLAISHLDEIRLGANSSGWLMANAVRHPHGIPYHHTVYPKKYAHGFCFAVLCCGYTLTDFPISIRLTSLALWQSNDCPSASKATLMNMDRYFMWIHYERLHNHKKAKHNKTVTDRYRPRFTHKCASKLGIID